jgi:hypothetical protein
VLNIRPGLEDITRKWLKPRWVSHKYVAIRITQIQLILAVPVALKYQYGRVCLTPVLTKLYEVGKDG